MTTRDSVATEVHKEHHILQAAWAELFTSMPAAEQEYLTCQDFKHPPPALRGIISEVCEEGYEQIRRSIGIAIDQGEVDPEDEAELVYQNLIGLAHVLALRMYKMGQHLIDRLPVDKITPCPCNILFDEDIEQFFNQKG